MGIEWMPARAPEPNRVRPSWYSGKKEDSIFMNSLRKERLRRNMTLEQLSQRTGLSKSFLSQIERGLAQPSITSLKKIAHQLGMSEVNFTASEENNHHPWKFTADSVAGKDDGAEYIGDVKIVRATRRKGLTLPGSDVVYELLTPDLNRKIEVMYLRTAKGEHSGEEPMSDPFGEKFGLVLRGVFEVRVRDDIYRLEAGDSIYFPAHFPHSWQGVEGDSIEVIWVLTPPCF
jgi:transcriptional regulator with XRE-family HTH domain